MSPFLSKAEEILEVAAAGTGACADSVILIDRNGGFRMMDPTGWTLSALAAEYGAAAVYRIEHRGSAVRVEGFDGHERCLLQKGENKSRLRSLLGGAQPFPRMLTA